MRLILVNPNTSAAITDAMVRIAEAVDPRVKVSGLTAPFGASLITDVSQLDMAANAVAALGTEILRRGPDAVIVSGFGDPGLGDLSEVLSCPTVGLAEAGMTTAAQRGRFFGVVTTTPGLVGAIDELAHRYGVRESFVGTVVTSGTPDETMSDSGRLLRAMEEACTLSFTERGAEAVVIGGGPLAEVARQLRSRFGQAVIEPIPAAVRLAVSRLGKS